MRVALLHISPDEHWPSIEVYADRLVDSMRGAARDVEFVQLRLNAWALPDWRLPLPYGRPATTRALRLYLSRWLRYPLALRGIQADIYHILDNSYGHLAFFTNPRRTIVTYHSGGSGPPRRLRHWHPPGPAQWMFRLAFRGMLRAGHIIAVSSYARTELQEETGYAAERIAVVHHGIDPRFQPLPAVEREPWRTRLLHPDDAYLLVHVGQSNARKNLETLYHALHILRREGLAIRLVRVGSAPTPAQQRLIEELELDQAITVFPHVPNRELPPYYAAADLFVFPSLYEGFGIPLIEAMACGTPVVCSDIDLFREICAQAVQYADANDPAALAQAIRAVLTNPALAGDLRTRGPERARHFTWERAARETLAVYRELYDRLN